MRLSECHAIWLVMSEREHFIQIFQLDSIVPTSAAVVPPNRLVVKNGALLYFFDKFGLSDLASSGFLSIFVT